MTFNVNNLVSSLNKTGIAKTSHFEVQITGADDTAIEEGLMARVDSTELPGRSLMTAEHKFTNYGPLNKVPYGGQVYTDLSMTIILSEDMREKEYFEYWQNKIVNTGAFEQTNRDGSVMSKFNTKYFFQYTGSVTIRQYGSAGDLRSIHILNEAYPIIINPITMSWSQDDIARLGVTFVYRNYRCVFNKQDQPSVGIRGGFSIGPGGFSGALSIPGIGNIASSIGGGLKTVQATVGNINNKVAQIRRSF
jgi:hypothetical protein